MTLVSAHLGFNLTNPLVDGGALLTGDDPNYYYRVFSGNGTLTVSNFPVTMDIVIVGGGGGGGAVAYTNFGGGGGGGGGGVIEYMSQTINPGAYPIVIGAGGTAGTNSVTPTNGGVTSGLSYSRNGGGRGASRTPSGFFSPLSGGSGGGGSTYINSGLGAGAGSEAIIGFVNGGNHSNGLSGGGGGGGAGAPGAVASINSGQGANGGVGRPSLFASASSLNAFEVDIGSGGGGGNASSSAIVNPGVYSITSIAESTPSVGYTTYYTTNTPSLRATVSISGATPSGYNVNAHVVDVNPGVSFSIVNSTTGAASGTIIYSRSSVGGSGLVIDDVNGLPSGQGGLITSTAVAAGRPGALWSGGGGGGGGVSDSFVSFGGAGGAGQVLLRYTRASVGG